MSKKVLKNKIPISKNKIPKNKISNNELSNINNSNTIKNTNKINNTIEDKYLIQNIKINYKGTRKNKSNDLINLSSPLSKFEKSVAVSIYDKYFKNNYLLKENKELKIDKNDFMNKLFMPKQSIHTNIDELKIELDKIEKANKAYEANPALYKNKKTEYGYPDKYRCMYIRYDKHKYYRCKCGVSNDDPDKTFCSRHYLIDNYHINEYLKLKLEIEKSKKK
tara:strand:- start:64 stop:726 length:663 start_codon:yes stop_codon:yes gene_type:complete